MLGYRHGDDLIQHVNNTNSMHIPLCKHHIVVKQLEHSIHRVKVVNNQKLRFSIHELRNSYLPQYFDKKF